MYDVTSYDTAAWGRLGREIRRRRAAKGLTQDQLGELAGCSGTTIRNLEAGKRGRQLTLPAICRALGWTEDSYLLILDGGPPMVEATPEEPVVDDALRVPRPEGVSDEEWAAISEKLVADLQFWLRTRRGP
jgi:transcriptional regulator with XRE-family HTH domain